MFTCPLLLGSSAKNECDLLVDNSEHPLLSIPFKLLLHFKEAMNYEASLASSFVQVTMLACQAKASDPLFQ